METENRKLEESVQLQCISSQSSGGSPATIFIAAFVLAITFGCGQEQTDQNRSAKNSKSSTGVFLQNSDDPYFSDAPTAAIDEPVLQEEDPYFSDAPMAAIDEPVLQEEDPYFSDAPTAAIDEPVLQEEMGTDDAVIMDGAADIEGQTEDAIVAPSSFEICKDEYEAWQETQEKKTLADLRVQATQELFNSVCQELSQVAYHIMDLEAEIKSPGFFTDVSALKAELATEIEKRDELRKKQDLAYKVHSEAKQLYDEASKINMRAGEKFDDCRLRVDGILR